jgi:hypothetical protein
MKPSMRNVPLTATWLIVLLLALPSVADGRGPHGKLDRCPRSHILAADAQAQAYLGRNPVGDLEIYGCAYAHPHPYLLGDFVEGSPSGAAGITHVSVGGPYVAYEDFFNSQQQLSRWIVIVRDLRTGRVVHRLPSGRSAPPDVGAGPVTDIALAADGSVAWIVATEQSYEVHIFDRSGERVVAQGAQIAPASLALTGHTLYWTSSGAAFLSSIT